MVVDGCQESEASWGWRVISRKCSRTVHHAVGMRVPGDYLFQQASGDFLPVLSRVKVRQSVSEDWRFLAFAVIVKVVAVAVTVTSYNPAPWRPGFWFSSMLMVSALYSCGLRALSFP